MFMRSSGPSLCDSRTPSYFDRPTAHISRYRSDDSYTSTTSSTMAMARKRPRVDSSYHNTARTPRLSTFTHNLDASASSFGLASPSPLANTDYRLLGGLDTPGTWSEQREERARMEDAERDYRQNRCTSNLDQSSFSDPSSITRRSLDDSTTDMTASTTLSGWHLRRTAWALTGGLAGKIISFCWTTTFRGFQAGGGQSYTIHDADDTDFAQDGYRFDPSRSPRLSHQSRGSLSTYLPQNQQSLDNRSLHGRDRGRIYNSNRNDSFHNPVETPVSHKRYTTTDDSAVKNNWVFVETTPTSPDERSPVRKRSRASVASPSPSRNRFQNNTNIPQPMMAMQMPPTSRTYTASFASPRATRTTSISSRTHSYGHSRNNSYTNTSTATTSPSSKSRSNANIKRSRPSTSTITCPISPTKKQQLSNTTPVSPLSPELESFKRSRRKETRRNNQSIHRLNSQLQDMIREGQQALGSRIEILEYGDGEGGESGMDSNGDSDDSGDMNMDGSYLRGEMR